MSQETLGEAVNLSFQQIQRYERATNRLSCSMLLRISEALGVAPTSLLPAVAASALQAGPSDPSSTLDALVADYLRLDANKQGAVQRLVHDLAPPLLEFLKRPDPAQDDARSADLPPGGAA